MRSVSPWGVYSVWRRHATVYRRTWLVNFLPPATEPILYLVSFGYGLAPAVGELIYHGRPVGYTAFIAPAMVAVAVLFQSFFEGAYGTFIRLRFQRTWHALLTAPLGYEEIFLGDWLWAATRGFIAGIVTGIVTVLLGLASPWAILFSIPTIILGSLLAAGMGMAVAGAVKTVDQINVPVFLFVLPQFTLCGTFFPRENLPQALAAVTAYLPLGPLVDLLRWHIATPPLWGLKIAVLVTWALLFAAAAWRLIRPHVFK